MKELVDGGYLPEEHVGQQGSTIEDAKFDKNLMVDLSQQAQQPTHIVSIDADKGSNRGNHISMSPGLIVLAQHMGAIAGMLCSASKP